MAEERMNGRLQQEQERADLAAREREIRKREFDALVMKAGIDEQELARLKVLAHLVGDAYCERIGELLDAEEEGSPARRSLQATRESRESGSSAVRRLRI
ncbi:MAG TPA: hypothetical protein VGU63_07550 [Candidatus Acidoferrales bacterium]|nr:hypothetical protein [Candidatus Acidoferrales bacterium]